MTAPVPPELLQKALRKITAALKGLGRGSAVIGDLAHRSYGIPLEPRAVEVLVPAADETLLSAARGEGLRTTDDALLLRWHDAAVAAAADVRLLEASTPRLARVLDRARPADILGVGVPVASCNDLILLRAGSADPADRKMLVELLRHGAGRIDPPLLKKEAEEAGVFDALRSAWQEARA